MKIPVSMLKSLWMFLVILLVMISNSIPVPLLIIFVFLAFAAPLVREFIQRSNMDERQVHISQFSSHLAYFVFSGLLALVIIMNWVKKSAQPNSIFYLLLFLPMTIKLIICAFQSYGSVKGFKSYVLLFFRGIIKSKQVDERQNYLGNFSSHNAFYVYIAFLLSYLIFNFFAQQQQPGNVWYMLLIVPLMTKLFVSLFHNYGAGKGARLILFTICGMWLLFVILSHGFSLGSLIEAIPFFIFLAVTLLSLRFPLISGIIFLTLAIAALFFFSGWSKFDIYFRLLMYSLIPLPIALCGAAFLVENFNKKKSEVQA